MNPLQQLYDLQTPVEMALAIAFARLQIKTYTPANDGFVTPEWNAANPDLAGNVLSPLEFQKQRPRLQIATSSGGAALNNFPSAPNVQPVGGYDHDLGRALIVGLRVVTKADILEHRAFLSLVRGTMATILRRVNGNETHADAIAGEQLTLHRITHLDESGVTATYTPEEGVYQTDLQYTGQITFQGPAVEALQTE